MKLASFRAQDAERPREKRPLALSPAPALGGGQHVELARLRRGAGSVAAADHHVGAVLLARGDGRHAAAERRCRPGHLTPLVRRWWWISCRESTSGSPRLAAAIARAAAIPPVIVV